jgi:hypothetical protein
MLPYEYKGSEIDISCDLEITSLAMKQLVSVVRVDPL